MRLTRSQLAAIDQELLDFCLNEVVKLQSKFETLEAHVLTFALERKFASINVVDEINFENLVSSFFLNDVHLVTIQQNIEYNYTISTQEVILPSNSNKVVKEVSIKKSSGKKKTSTKISGTLCDKKVAAKKTT